MLLFACVGGGGLAGFPFCIHALTSLGMKFLARELRQNRPLSNTFQYFPHSWTKLSETKPNWPILVSLLDKQTGSLQMFFQHHKYRSITKNQGSGWLIICFKSLEMKQKALDRFLVPAPISSSFLVCFWVF
jgi:hypothetical protein